MRAQTSLPVAFALALSVLASGCGFTPLYASGGPDGNGKGSLIGPVTIDEIKGKSGHIVRAELNKMLLTESGGPPRHLKITTSEGVVGLGYRVDETASRADVVLTGTYQLLDTNEKVLASGNATAVAGYGVPASAYGEFSAHEDAREKAAENLARLIFAKLNLQLSKAQTKGETSKK
jgi:LPS-assembly lipoprotein